MMFVQSLRGISHNKIEDTKEEHLELAVRGVRTGWRDKPRSGYREAGLRTAMAELTHAIVTLASESDGELIGSAGKSRSPRNPDGAGDGMEPGHRRSPGARSISPAPRKSITPSPVAKRAFAEWRATPFRAGPKSCSSCASWSMPTAAASPRCSRSSMARPCRTPWAKSRAASKTSNSPAAFRNSSKAAIPNKPAAASTCIRSASLWGWSPASRRSTFRPWSPCGCSPTPSPAATPSS